MSAAQGRFDGGQVRERIIRTRVNAALADLPPALRKLRYDEEYKRQTELYNQERKEKRRAKSARNSERIRSVREQICIGQRPHPPGADCQCADPGAPSLPGSVLGTQSRGTPRIWKPAGLRPSQ